MAGAVSIVFHRLQESSRKREGRLDCGRESGTHQETEAHASGWVRSREGPAKSWAPPR